VYSVAVASLPGGRGDGQPITALIDLESGTRPTQYFAGAAETMLLLANSGGFGLLAKVGDMVGRNRGGKSFFSVDDAHEPLPPVAVAAAHTQVACLSLSTRLLVFPLDELKHQPNGGKGLTLMDVDDQDPLVSVTPCADQLRLLGLGRGGKPKDEMLKGAALDAHVGRRARKGLKCAGFVRLQRLAPA
jgi:topoisomerase IV subunit A